MFTFNASPFDFRLINLLIYLLAILMVINDNNSSVAGVWLFKFSFLMQGALAFSHLLMPVALTLLDYQYLCL
jgi:hypothetical protein